MDGNKKMYTWGNVISANKTYLDIFTKPSNKCDRNASLQSLLCSNRLK